MYSSLCTPIPLRISAVNLEVLDSLLNKLTVDSLLNKLTVDSLLNKLTVDSLLNKLTVDSLLNKLTVDSLLNKLTVDSLLNKLTVDSLLNKLTVAITKCCIWCAQMFLLLNLYYRPKVNLFGLHAKYSFRTLFLNNFYATSNIVVNCFE